MLTLLMLSLLSDPGLSVAPDDIRIDRSVERLAPLVEQATRGCPEPLMNASGLADGAPVLDRSRDEGPARRYLLLDRRDRGGCPLPISYAVPDQPQALGRNLATPDAQSGVRNSPRFR